ncbi:MAG TPA: hypothetical protein VIF57_30965 [Polyangia bacterium]|jgi:hypothetical protein
MRARRPQGPISSLLVNLSLAAIVVCVGAARARAQDPPPPDPFAAEPLPAVPDSNVAERSQQAPASAPAGSSANFPTGLVERLPASAYPEPVIRGLYGGSMWLDMQGHQWPYYPRIGVGVSGYGWVDTDYKYTRIGDPGQSSHIGKMFAQGRYALRLTPTYGNGTWFVQAQAELIANLNQGEAQPKVADTDDLWIRTGVWKQWDITVGRFEAFPVYHLGMGLDLNTDERTGAYDASNIPPQPYLVSFIYYRPAFPALTNAAIHYYTRDLRAEVLGTWGNDGLLNNLGGRGALIFDKGWLKLRGAAEYLWQFPPDPNPTLHNEHRNRGLGGSAQFVFDPWVEFGGNIGRAVVDFYSPNTLQPDGSYLPDTSKSGDIWSFGGFLNARLFEDALLGVGYNYTSFANLHVNTATGEHDTTTNAQYFVALQYLVHHQLFVKVVGAYAKSHFDLAFSSMNSYDDDMFSVRVRLMYLY